MTLDHLRDPQAIYRRSFAIVRAEADFGGLPAELAEVAVRLVHACGDPAVVASLRASPGAGEAGRAALRAGATVFTDTTMVAQGVIRARLPAENRVECTLDADGVALAAIQGLHQLVQEKDAAISIQQRRIEKLEARLQAIEARIMDTNATVK